MIKAVFHTPLRALQGFIKSIIIILGLNLICPHYSVFSRRAKGLQIPMRKLLKPGEKLNVIFDSTGVKVFGEGEWKVRKHGYSKRRTWRKVHIGMCADSGQVVISAMSSNSVSDEEAMIHMMGALEGIELGDVLGDGAYDTIDCREAIHDYGGRQIIPPDKNARLQKRKTLPALDKRDKAIRRIEELGDEGRAHWKKEIGYHRRSRVETAMFRYKTIVGDRLTARRKVTQATEVAVKWDVLNRMTELGMPKSYKVAAIPAGLQAAKAEAFEGSSFVDSEQIFPSRPPESSMLPAADSPIDGSGGLSTAEPKVPAGIADKVVG